MKNDTPDESYLHEGTTREFPRMTAVHSSNVVAVGYDKYDDKRGNLFVLFHGGGFYVYRRVPETVAMELVNATSIGQYLNQHVKDVYDADKLDTPDGLLDRLPKKKGVGDKTISWDKLSANRGKKSR